MRHRASSHLSYLACQSQFPQKDIKYVRGLGSEDQISWEKLNRKNEKQQLSWCSYKLKTCCIWSRLWALGIILDQLPGFKEWQQNLQAFGVLKVKLVQSFSNFYCNFVFLSSPTPIPYTTIRVLFGFFLFCLFLSLQFTVL